jgi:hypothetical protein
MRKIILWFTGVLLSISGFSQMTADFGLWGGGSGYFGDIENNTLTQTSFPILGAFYRHNFNQRVSARAMFLTGKVGAEGVIQNYDWQFSKNVQDLSVQIEINFLRYMVGNKRYPFTSYLTAGLGGIRYPYDPPYMYAFNPGYPKLNYDDNPDDSDDSDADTEYALTLPFGMGFKFNFWKKIGLGVEYQMRKILNNDCLDDLNDPLAHNNIQGDKVTYTDYVHNNDWISYIGLQMTFNFYIGTKACPAYDKKR